jgi:serine/threonine protein kinase
MTDTLTSRNIDLSSWDILYEECIMHIFIMIKLRAKSFFSQILTAEPHIPDGLSPEASDFVSKLLVKDPQERLGGGEDDAEELKRHPFFRVSFSPCHIFVIF